MDTIIYPRKSGYCKAHNLDKTFSFEEFEEALDFLLRKKVDIVKGDLIIFNSISGYRNEGVAIYSGETIIHLDYDIDDYGSLPRIFKPIEDKVPLLYWHGGKDRIEHNTITWMRISSATNEVIHPPTYSILNGKHTIYTVFIYRDIKYTLVYDDEDIHKSASNSNVIRDALSKFKALLTQRAVIPINILSDFYELSVNAIYYIP